MHSLFAGLLRLAYIRCACVLGLLRYCPTMVFIGCIKQGNLANELTIMRLIRRLALSYVASDSHTSIDELEWGGKNFVQ